MDPYDTAATRAVWNRVLQSQPETQAPIVETLRVRIDAEHAARLTYLALARCAGRYAGTLRTIAAQEGVHARTLSALYYLHTGECHAPEAAPARPTNFCQSLRECYQAELQSAARYRADAEHYPEHCTLFTRLANDEARHSRMLHKMACQLLGMGR